MKKVLALGLALSVASSQVFSYNLETLNDVENASACIKSAEVIIHALTPEANATLESMGNVANQVNLLAAYATRKQSSIMRVSRILEALNKNASWQKALDKGAVDKEFFKNFGFTLTKQLAEELVRYATYASLAETVDSMTDNALVSRTAETAAISLVVALFETLSAHVKHATLGKDGAEGPKTSDVFTESLLTNLFTEAAYNMAGALIEQGASDSRHDLVEDLKSAVGCDN